MKVRNNTSNPYYPDIHIFLILIPFISAFNYYLTYSDIQFNWFLVLTYTIDTTQGYAAWLGVRYFILFLDKKWPYDQKTALRIVFQVIITTIIGLVVIVILTELVSWIARGRPAPLNFYTIDLFIISIWFLVMNGVYIGLHYYKRWEKTKALLDEQSRIKSEGFIIRVGTKELQLGFNKLAGFYVDGNYVTLCTLAGKEYYLDQSLNEVENTLPSDLFFRLNRQYIVHRQIISGFRRAKNGKIKVLLNREDLLKPEIPVSRTKAPQFKSWFRPD